MFMFQKQMVHRQLIFTMGTKIGPLCDELGIAKQTLYRHISPTCELHTDGKKLFGIV